MGAGPAVTALAHFRMRVSAKLGLPGYQPYERLGLWLKRELSPLVDRLVLGDAFLSRGICRPGQRCGAWSPSTAPARRIERS